jgi:Gpi18-like mannosyltransferase
VSNSGSARGRPWLALALTILLLPVMFYIVLKIVDSLYESDTRNDIDVSSFYLQRAFVYSFLLAILIYVEVEVWKLSTKS